MQKELRKHVMAYAVLLAGFSMFLALFLAAWPDHTLQRIIIASFVLFYFLWGLMTHVKTTTLTRKVAIEYAAVALLGGIFLLILTI
jgi:predicted lysophospholipase L1 biosynthesis ABC-type transport system permease subunit